MSDGVDSSALNGKIVLFAYATPFNPMDIEDKKFTPMNEKYAGKSIPDMNGIIVHANIISMVMEDNFIKKVPLFRQNTLSMNALPESTALVNSFSTSDTSNVSVEIGLNPTNGLPLATANIDISGNYNPYG